MFKYNKINLIKKWANDLNGQDIPPNEINKWPIKT